MAWWEGPVGYPSQRRCLGLGYDQGPGLGPQYWSSQGDLCGCLWLWSSLWVVQGFVVWVPLESRWCPRAALPWGTYMPTWVACTAPWGHADNLTGATAKDHVCVRGPSMARVCVNVPDPWCYQGLRRCLGSGLQPDTVFVSEGCASAGAKWIWSRLWTGAMILSRPWLQVRAMSGSMVKPQSVSVLISVVWDRLRPCCCRGHAGPDSLRCLLGPRRHLGPCLSLVLPQPKSVLMFLPHAVTKGHVDAGDLGYNLQQRGHPRAMLPP